MVCNRLNVCLADARSRLELYTPDQWEIDKDSVTLDRMIGQGHFGQVYQGVLKLSDGTLKSCAVKVTASNCFIKRVFYWFGFI